MRPQEEEEATTASTLQTNQNTYITSVVYVAQPRRGSWVDSSVVTLVTLWIKFKVRRNCQKRALCLPLRWKYTNSIFVLVYPRQPPFSSELLFLFLHYLVLKSSGGMCLELHCRKKKMKIRWEFQVWIKVVQSVSFLSVADTGELNSKVLKM